MLSALLIAARPKQWTKNLFIFAALVFDRKLFEADPLAKTIYAFILFVALSSSVYLVNDVADLEKDRQHPTKRHRPIAAGVLSTHIALVAAVVLGISALILGTLLDPRFGLIELAYLVLQTAYTYFLKHWAIVDVLTVAGGFVLRVMAGTVVIEAERFSPWLYICITLLALFLGLSKRCHELVLLEGQANLHRRILAEYTPELLEEMIAVVTSATVIAYSLYTFSAENLPSNHAMMLTIPFVLYGVFRYLYIVHRKDLAGSPEEALLRDVPLIVNNLLWGAAVVLILYWFR
ncbi:MAG: decaprenyl-phosphate phosphoribosyltransferase [Chloroflexi bacterium]|nr:decaprenyl-phosphate phosphoribosyltransferase [Chloroflexota bacterium]